MHIISHSYDRVELMVPVYKIAHQKAGSMCIATNAVSDDDERGPVKQRVSTR